jgi:class 3 adenylate cyclase/tetratricopeptide (TPR) repeat protein
MPDTPADYERTDYRATVSSFVPAIIRARAVASDDLLSAPGKERHFAGVLFADISGFTALTEQLSKRGPEGAEELTRLLNMYFGRIIDAIELAGGDVLKFAGDALLAIWDAPDQAVDLDDVTVRITEVSRRLQSDMHDFEVAPGIRLSMKLAIGAGEVDVEHLGGVFDRWEFLVSGRPLAQLGRANHAAAPGDVVLATEAGEHLPDGYQLVPAADGVVRLLSADNDFTSFPPAAEAELPDDNETEQLLTFLPAAIRQRVAAGHAEWLSELRAVSIVFMNLPGFGVDTPLERAQEAMRTLQTCLYRYEGSINKVSVDDKGASLIAVLGLPPLSHTDDPQRALRAAIDMHAGLNALGLASSIGVCSGTAFCGVVGNDRRREYTVMGDVVNLSARLMQAASGGILCDEQTRNRAGSRIEFQTLAPLIVKGKAAPVPVFIPELRDTAGGTAKMPRVLQGRVLERRRLAELLDIVLAATATALPRICVSAERGSGKWSVVSEMLQSATDMGAQVLVCAGDPLDTLTPFRAWRGPLQIVLGAAEGGDLKDLSTAAILERLPNRHARDHAPLLRDVVPMALTDNTHTEGLSGEARREHLLQLLAELLLAQVQLGPTVLALRDVHLLDASSWDLAARIDAAAPNLLIAATMRADGTHANLGAREWLELETTEQLRLDPLANDALAALAVHRIGARRADDALVALLKERAAGNPLYCEELVAALQASGRIEVRAGVACLLLGGGDDNQDFPESLHGLISSRVDRLDPRAQMTLKVASVAGRLFSVPFVAAVHPTEKDPRKVADDVRVLLKRDLVSQVPFGSRAEFGRAPFYQFKNELVRDVAYGLMLYSQRRALHRRVALWVENDRADELAPHFASLGRHWALAAEGAEIEVDALNKAVSYLERAGDRATHSLANHEAAGLFREALERLEGLPESAARDEQELDLALKLGGPLVTIRSYADEQVVGVYNRARVLGERAGEHRKIFATVRGLWQAAVGRSDYSTASDLADELIVLARRAGDTSLELEAHRAIGNSNFWPGRLEKARESMEYAARFADRYPDAPLPEGFAQDPDIANRGLLAWTLASLGRPESALAHLEAAIARGHVLKNHPFSMAYAVGSAMWTYFVLRDELGVSAHAEQMVEISEQYGYPYFAVAGRVALRWCEAEQGKPAQALAPLREAIAGWREASGGIGIALFLCVQAEVEKMAGKLPAALATLSDPLLEARLEAEQWYLADVVRLRAECEFLLGNVDLAAASWRQARRIAIEQNARIAALRIACCEAQLLARDEHWAALRAALSALPESHENGTIEIARRLISSRAGIDSVR